MPTGKMDDYWEAHRSQYGKRDRMSQGSVADRGGYNDRPAYTQEDMSGAKKRSSGHGFGKKKKKDNPGHGGY